MTAVVEAAVSDVIDAVSDVIDAVSDVKDESNSTWEQEWQGSSGLQASCDVYDFIINVVVTGSLCVLGWIGNTLSFLVMWPDRSRSSTSFTLLVLAVIDNLVLAFRFIMKTIPAFCSFHEICPAVSDVISTYVGMVGWGLNSMAQQATTYNAVIMTAIRYISVCVPHRAKTLATVRMAQRACVVNVIAAAVFNLPRMVQRKLVYDSDGKVKTVKLAFSDTYAYQVGYLQVAFFLVFYIIPLTILIVLTSLLIRSLRKASKKRQEMTQRAQERQDITTTLVAVVIVFIVCQLFTPIRRIITFALPSNEQHCPYPYHFFNELNSTAVVFNSAINFILYCLFGKRFRRHLRELMTCHRRVNPSEVSVSHTQDQGTTANMPMTASVLNGTKSRSGNYGVEDS